jgi:hypothetical protein
MKLELDIDEDDLSGILKGLRNESARLRVMQRSGDHLDKFADLIEAAAIQKKPIQTERGGGGRKVKKA